MMSTAKTQVLGATTSPNNQMLMSNVMIGCTICSYDVLTMPMRSMAAYQTKKTKNIETSDT